MHDPTQANERSANKLARRATRTERFLILAGALAAILWLMIFPSASRNVAAQATGPTMLVPNLAVRTVATGFVTPTTMAFLGPNEMLVLEKGSGKVQHVVNGAIQNTALDLAVNNASERGLLGVALRVTFLPCRCWATA